MNYRPVDNVEQLSVGDIVLFNGRVAGGPFEYEEAVVDERFQDEDDETICYFRIEDRGYADWCVTNRDLTGDNVFWPTKEPSGLTQFLMKTEKETTNASNS